MRSKGQTEVKEAVDHALAVPSDYGKILVQDENFEVDVDATEQERQSD